jgi:hypothetical protein
MSAEVNPAASDEERQTERRGEKIEFEPPARRGPAQQTAERQVRCRRQRRVAAGKALRVDDDARRPIRRPGAVDQVLEAHGQEQPAACGDDDKRHHSIPLSQQEITADCRDHERQHGNAAQRCQIASRFLERVWTGVIVEIAVYRPIKVAGFPLFDITSGSFQRKLRVK